MPAGRPSDYEPSFCERVVELGKLGKSKVQIAVALGIVRQTLDDWTKVHPEFLDAMQKARDASQDWWEEQGQKGVWGKGFNAAAWAKSISARFPDDYTERSKSEMTGKDGAPLFPDVKVTFGKTGG